MAPSEAPLLEPKLQHLKAQLKDPLFVRTAEASHVALLPALLTRVRQEAPRVRLALSGFLGAGAVISGRDLRATLFTDMVQAMPRPHGRSL